MINLKITDEELDYVTEILDIVDDCRLSHSCLWHKQEKLLANFLRTPFYDCKQDSCPVVVFRKRLESESPTLYSMALFSSKAKNVIRSAHIKLQNKRLGPEQRRRKYFKRFDEIKAIDHILILALYPLSLKVDSMPPLSDKEVTAFLERYNSDPEQRSRNLERMSQISPDWFYWLNDAMLSLLSKNSQYAVQIFFMIYLFLEGLERDALPDLKEMPEEDKNKFFNEIEQGMSPIRKLALIFRAILAKKMKTD
jgi:hypothetical protein